MFALGQCGQAETPSVIGSLLAPQAQMLNRRSAKQSGGGGRNALPHRVTSPIKPRWNSHVSTSRRTGRAHSPPCCKRNVQARRSRWARRPAGRGPFARLHCARMNSARATLAGSPCSSSQSAKIRRGVSSSGWERMSCRKASACVMCRLSRSQRHRAAKSSTQQRFLCVREDVAAQIQLSHPPP